MAYIFRNRDNGLSITEYVGHSIGKVIIHRLFYIGLKKCCGYVRITSKQSTLTMVCWWRCFHKHCWLITFYHNIIFVIFRYLIPGNQPRKGGCIPIQCFPEGSVQCRDRFATCVDGELPVRVPSRLVWRGVTFITLLMDMIIHHGWHNGMLIRNLTSLPAFMGKKTMGRFNIKTLSYQFGIHDRLIFIMGSPYW